MKKLLLLLTLLSGLATAQTIQVSGNASSQSVPPAYVTPDCTISGSFTATGNSTILNNADTGCSTWNIVYSATSGISVLSLEVDFASEGATVGTPGSFTIWPSTQIGSGTLPFTVITESAATLSGYHPYIRVVLTSLTGSGTIKYKLYGWKGQGSSDVVNSANSVVGSTTAADPCQSSGVTRQSVAINIGSATTTQIVALAAGKKISVCGYSVTVLGLITTAGTLQFEYGTGASCGTGTTVLTGAMQGVATAGVNILFLPGGSGTFFSTATSNALCLVTTGTAPSFQGFVTFVQI